MDQVQCPNCGGFKIRTNEAHFDATTGQIRDTPIAYFHEREKVRIEGPFPRNHSSGTDLISLSVDLVVFVIWLFSLPFKLIARSSQKQKDAQILAKWRSLPKGFQHQCELCGYEWSLKNGDSPPQVNVRPDLIAKGYEKIEQNRRLWD